MTWFQELNDVSFEMEGQQLAHYLGNGMTVVLLASRYGVKYFRCVAV